MYVYIGIGVVWIFCVIGGITYQKNFKSNKAKFKVFNISDRVVKGKRYQSALNERTKAMFK